LNMANLKDLYEKVSERLLLLNQKLVLSSSTRVD
jgi:hypothetical protein